MSLRRVYLAALIGGPLSLLAGRWTGDMKGSWIFWVGLVFGAWCASEFPFRRKELNDDRRQS